jgi:hypothetical protein
MGIVSHISKALAGEPGKPHDRTIIAGTHVEAYRTVASLLKKRGSRIGASPASRAI